MVSVETITPEPETDTDLLLRPFEEWFRYHRGIGEQSIRNHSRRVATLVLALGPDPRSYDAAGIREALLSHYAGVSRGGAAHLADFMRMYLRYLTSIGICSPTLVESVPTVANWRLNSLPRYISPDQVEHVIACCDLTPLGLRDKAILLLLSRLALRAGDIVGLRLADIEWRNAFVRVCRKSRCQEALPLPQDVGDAILAYIEKSLPRVSQDKIFLSWPHIVA